MHVRVLCYLDCWYNLSSSVYIFLLDHYDIFFYFSLLFVYISGENGSNVGERNIVRSFTFFDTYTSLGEVMFYIDANFSSLNFIIFKQG